MNSQTNASLLPFLFRKWLSSQKDEWFSRKEEPTDDDRRLTLSFSALHRAWRVRTVTTTSVSFTDTEADDGDDDDDDHDDHDDDSDSDSRQSRTFNDSMPSNN